MRAGIGLRFYHLPTEGTYEVSSYAGTVLGTVEKFSKGWTARYTDGSNIGWFARRAEAGDALFSHRRAVAPHYPKPPARGTAEERIEELERELERYRGLLDEAKGYIEALEEELRAAHSPAGECLCIGDA